MKEAMSQVSIEVCALQVYPVIIFLLSPPPSPVVLEVFWTKQQYKNLLLTLDNI